MRWLKAQLGYQHPHPVGDLRSKSLTDRSQLAAADKPRQRERCMRACAANFSVTHQQRNFAMLTLVGGCGDRRDSQNSAVLEGPKVALIVLGRKKESEI